MKFLSKMKKNGLKLKKKSYDFFFVEENYMTDGSMQNIVRAMSKWVSKRYYDALWMDKIEEIFI